MENKERTGFIAPVITEDNHIFGSSGINLPVIKVDGDWTKYLPTFESQLETTFDSDGCTVYGTLNAIETLEDYLTGKEPNYSDRFVYNTVGITPPGSDPHLVATTIRGNGLVNEEDLPSVVSSLAEFMTPRPLPVELRIKGQKWLNKRMLGHQWLWTGKPDHATRLDLLKEGLTKGTVCVSVSAWYQNDQGLYYSPADSINAHWCEIYNIDDTGIYVFDSYLTDRTYLKKLTLDHDIQFAKVYFETIPDQTQNWLIQLIISFLGLLGLYQKKQTLAQSPVSVPVVEAPKPPEISKYDWSSKELVRHSIRVIGDEFGMTVLQKDLLCDIAGCESGFNIKVRGKIDPRDRGLYQWNSKYHPEITDEIVFDPEKNTRLACNAIINKQAHTFWSASEFCWNKNHKYDSLL